jgi:hypothetical protein
LLAPLSDPAGLRPSTLGWRFPILPDLLSRTSGLALAVRAMTKDPM